MPSVVCPRETVSARQRANAQNTGVHTICSDDARLVYADPICSAAHTALYRRTGDRGYRTPALPAARRLPPMSRGAPRPQPHPQVEAGGVRLRRAPAPENVGRYVGRTGRAAHRRARTSGSRSHRRPVRDEQPGGGEHGQQVARRHRHHHPHPRRPHRTPRPRDRHHRVHQGRPPRQGVPRPHPDPLRHRGRRLQPSHSRRPCPGPCTRGSGGHARRAAGDPGQAT